MTTTAQHAGSSKRLGLALWGNEPIQTTLRNVQLAEAIGLDSVWLVDSQMICREVYVTLAACAAATTRIKLATGVTIPFTRHPSVMASAFATLNELSGGRAVIGFGSGNSSLQTIGLKPAKVAEVETYLKTLRGLLQGIDVELEAGVRGKITWLDTASAIPIYLSASGPRVTKLAARATDGVILLQGIAPALLTRGIQTAAEGAQEAGKDPENVEVICWTYVGMSSDGISGRDHVRGRVAAALKVAIPEWFSAEDRAVIEELRRQYDYLKHASSDPRHAAIVPDRLVDQFAIAGTPEEMREGLRALMAQPGVSQIVLSPQVSGQGSMAIETFLRRLADDVLSKL